MPGQQGYLADRRDDDDGLGLRRTRDRAEPEEAPDPLVIAVDPAPSGGREGCTRSLCARQGFLAG